MAAATIMPKTREILRTAKITAKKQQKNKEV
jgi:hypothetical protein